MVLGQRAREQQRPDDEADHGQGVGHELPFEQLAIRAALRCPQQDHSDEHHQQEWALFQERVRRVGEVDLSIGGTQRADRERGQERPNAHRRSDADPLEDVEDEVHRAVP